MSRVSQQALLGLFGDRLAADGTLVREGFARWFADSQVTDENGLPLVVYHGTRAEFTEFTPSRGGEYGGGVYLTPDANAAWMYAERARGDGGLIVMPVYACIRNPFLGGREGARAAGVRNLMARGYDGIVGVSSTGERQLVAFRPTQIKSAIGNSGLFDPHSQDLTDAHAWATPAQRERMRA